MQKSTYQFEWCWDLSHTFICYSISTRSRVYSESVFIVFLELTLICVVHMATEVIWRTTERFLSLSYCRDHGKGWESASRSSLSCTLHLYCLEISLHFLQEGAIFASPSENSHVTWGHVLKMTSLSECHGFPVFISSLILHNSL